MRLGTGEIIFILIVVLLIFGPGRIVKVASELGKSVKAFKDGLDESETSKEDESEKKEDSNSK
jgi:sec-independent protein translocase protein TatA